jgi:hypothetical protein
MRTRTGYQVCQTLIDEVGDLLSEDKDEFWTGLSGMDKASFLPMLHRDGVIRRDLKRVIAMVFSKSAQDWEWARSVPAQFKKEGKS